MAANLHKEPAKLSPIVETKIERPNFDKEVLEPLRAVQAAKQAELDKLAAEEAERLRQAEITSKQVIKVTYTPLPTATGGFSGSIGYVSPMNNCVTFVKQFRAVPFGNPISWQPTTRTPFVGALVLFPYNHVGYVVGINANGTIEVAHANAPGAGHTFSLNQVRGFL